jgi:hypothetical protein
MGSIPSKTEVQRRFLAPSAGSPLSAPEIVRVLVQEFTQETIIESQRIGTPLRGFRTNYPALGATKRHSPAETPDETYPGTVELVCEGAD